MKAGTSPYSTVVNEQSSIPGRWVAQGRGDRGRVALEANDEEIEVVDGNPLGTPTVGARALEAAKRPVQ